MARGIDTKCIHLEEDEGQCSHYGALSYPIYQTATYAHPGVGQSTGFDYSRLQNPTREHLEKMVAALENGIDAARHFHLLNFRMHHFHNQSAVLTLS